MTNPHDKPPAPTWKPKQYEGPRIAGTTHRYPPDLADEVPSALGKTLAGLREKPAVSDNLPAGVGAALNSLTGKQRAVLIEAATIVSGARQKAYGSPEDNFGRIARYWQAYFENTGRPEARVSARDVSALMRLMKQARLDETPDHHDSLVDTIGYVLTQIRTIHGEG